jgi:hypothetical protein
VKPDNVLFTEDGRPLVADLGLGKHYRRDVPGARRSVSVSATGRFIGTAGYAPREQIEDTKSVGPEADVFALGAVLYECLAGVPAFSGVSDIDAITRVSDHELEPLRVHCPELSHWLEEVVTKALAPLPGGRYRDGWEMARALAKRDPGETGGARGRRRTLLAIVVAGGVVVGGVGLVSWGHGRHGHDRSPAPESVSVASVASREQGDSEVLFRRGWALEMGQGVEKDEAEAFQWYHRAAEAGHVNASYKLGVMLEDGRGCDKNEKDAVFWYRKAAEAGQAQAMANLGLMLRTGRGCEKNEKDAVFWYGKAASRGPLSRVSSCSRTSEIFPMTMDRIGHGAQSLLPAA